MKKYKMKTPAQVHKELMKYKSYRESTPRTKELKLKMALARRRK